MWIQVFVHSGVTLGQAVTPHAGELSVGEQRGGFTGYASAADCPCSEMHELQSLWNRACERGAIGMKLLSVGRCGIELV